MPDCNTKEQNAIIDRAKQLVSTYEDMSELIRLGAYRQGSDVLVDEAIHYFSAIEEFLKQGRDDHSDLEASYTQLAKILDMQYGEEEAA